MATSPLPPRTLADLLPDHREVAALGDFAVSGLCLDSRHCAPGDVFLAVRGATSDGRRHIGDALARGCVAVIAEAEDADGVLPPVPESVPLLRVAELHRHLSAIAGRFHGNPGAALDITAITGTNGKTSCGYLLAQLLELLGDSAAMVGTLGYGRVAGAALEPTGLTTPDALRTQRILADFVAEGVTAVTMEVSSHSLDQYRVAAVPFATAIFTNLSRDHLDYHGSFEAYGAAKARLFNWPSLRAAIINRDDPFGRGLLAALPGKVRGIDYGIGGDGQVGARDIAYTHTGISARIHTPWGEGRLHSPLLGAFNLSNLLAVVAAACVRGFPLAAVLEQVPRLKPVSGRMEVINPGDGHQPLAVVDYAHTPDALDKALQALRHHCRGQLWCLFGCGGDRDAGKRPLMGAIAAQRADRLVVTSDNPRGEDPDAIIRDILEGIPATAAVETVADRRAAIRRALGEAAPGDTVLIAGKGHEDYQLVGVQRLPFSDQAEARLALRQRRGPIDD